MAISVNTKDALALIENEANESIKLTAKAKAVNGPTLVYDEKEFDVHQQDEDEHSSQSILSAFKASSLSEAFGSSR